ncbi:hypothetical protein D3C85_1932490 [compost metagenome]
MPGQGPGTAVSAAYEGQQVGVDDIGMGGGHAVGVALVGFQGAVAEQPGRQQA